MSGATLLRMAPEISTSTNGGPQRLPVSRANKIAAAKVFIAASKVTGQPVPPYIAQLANETSTPGPV